MFIILSTDPFLSYIPFFCCSIIFKWEYLHVLVDPLNIFLKMGHSRSLIQHNTVDSKQMFYIKICRWLDSNGGPLVLEATSVPTEPQPLPNPDYLAQLNIGNGLLWEASANHAIG